MQGAFHFITPKCELQSIYRQFLIFFLSNPHLGIVSHGISCAHQHYPGTYTNVPMLTAWIIANTQDSVYCTN
jgi:hypothetical protein